ncbi:hypothetical protein CFIMG_006084RA [Ceratocystis fimbriata CBS 114723]|uniref:Selenoprotein W-like protein n=1 Tax=Ceratocystis fimbriata CBS 114723 TaxID=1035309 RepID=A0A2C5WU34_9PEZI|nr:hypothetical protein CFIMG_006084RA [Ceratocystis fimbriata CBS 114723]
MELATFVSISTQNMPEASVFPRITIQFCTQCKWMLRATYFAQELLSTFSTALGEVALQPGTGGVFIVRIESASASASASDSGPGSDLISTHILWDRAVDGGFPETKELKRRVRDVIQPGRDLGHNDRVKRKAQDAKDGVLVDARIETIEPSTQCPAPETQARPIGAGENDAIQCTSGDC